MNAAAASEADTRTCALCGEDARLNYMACEERERMERDGLCFQCAFWELRAESPNPTVIDGVVYTPGSRTSGTFRGMAGRRFDIEYIADGRRITTVDLWCGGAVPERWRARIPDTARFLGGAESVLVGETMCFRPSERAADPYPLPDGRPFPAVTA